MTTFLFFKVIDIAFLAYMEKDWNNIPCKILFFLLANHHKKETFQIPF